MEQIILKLTAVNWKRVQLKLMSNPLGLACTCKACKERMPNCICLGWASKCLLNEGEKLEISHDKTSSKERKTNQKDCRD